MEKNSQKYRTLFETLYANRISISTSWENKQSDVMPALGFKPYQKKAMLVFARALTQPDKFVTSWGQTLTGEIGDFSIISVAEDGSKDSWPIDRDIFARSYTILDPEHELIHEFISRHGIEEYKRMLQSDYIPVCKSAPVWMMEIDETITIPTLEGDCEAGPEQVLLVGVLYEPYAQTKEKFLKNNFPV